MTSPHPPTSPPEPSGSTISDLYCDAFNALDEIANIAVNYADGAEDSGEGLEWATVLSLCERQGVRV